MLSESMGGDEMSSNFLVLPPARFACIFSLLGVAFVANASAQNTSRSFELMEATIPQLQAALATGTITSKDLVAPVIENDGNF
jgi:hypothetical protein